MVMEEQRKQEAIEAMIMEMVTGPEEQVAPCIRNALERNWEQSLPSSLEEFQKKRKDEIERVCSRYYAEFLGSVQELLTAKSRSAALRHQIVRFNDELRVTGQDTLKAGLELQRHKLAKRNINAATVLISQCRELTSLMATAKQQIQENRVYPALRTVDSISQQLSQALDQPFVRRVKAWLPELAYQIKVSALTDVAQWLVANRSNCTKIGKGALRKCCASMTGQAAWSGSGGGDNTAVPTPAKQVMQQIDSVVDFSPYLDVQAVIAKSFPQFLLEPEGEENKVFTELPESLQALHRALYIHARLSALDEMRSYYKNNRLPQATVPTATGGASADEWVVQMTETLAYFAGFFVTEYTAVKAADYPEGLLSLAELEDTWWVIQKGLCQQIDAGAARLTSPLHFIQLKQTIVLLAYTLGEDCFRFNTQALLDQMRALRERFQAVQLATLQSASRQILQDEVYQPLSVGSEKEYRTLVLPFGIDRQDLGVGGADDSYLDDMELSPAVHHKRGTGGGVRYPRTFPFSAVVPRLCVETYRMYFACFLYGLQLQLPAMENTVLQLAKGGMTAIARLMNDDLNAGTQSDANFPISKACQISIDAVALAKMTYDVDRLLQFCVARFYTTEAPSKVADIMANAKREFENTSIAAQHLVFELIRAKIDELLGGMCFIEWDAPSISTKPRSYVDDVISYLQVTFMCLTYLPKSAREGLHFASCSHISSVMTETLLDPRRVKAVNTNGLYNLSVDLSALESFADSCGVTQLRECFAELRQTLGSLLHKDIDTIMRDPTLREGVYPKLDAAKLITILEKYRPLALLSQVKNQQRTDTSAADLPYLDKKRLAEYIKALKAQV